VSIANLGNQVAEGYSAADREWLIKLIRALEHDGMVRTRSRNRKTVAVSLP
jgi:hypothetical protein